MISSAKEGPILDQHDISSHLSHQPHLYVLIYFCVVKLVLIALTHVVKIESTHTEVVDGSNESLYHADQELDPPLRKKSPLQTILKKFSVMGTTTNG